MPCKNKPDFLYFVVAIFYVAARANYENRLYLRKTTTMIYDNPQV
jgi:hypothetical protein